MTSQFSETGEYNLHAHFQDCYSAEVKPLFEASKEKILSPQDPDFEALRPFFLWLPAETIEKTFRATTQYARNYSSLPHAETLQNKVSSTKCTSTQ